MYLPPNFLLNADFQNFKWYFHHLFFHNDEKGSYHRFKALYLHVLCRFKYSFGSDFLLLVVLYCKHLFV